MIPHVEAMIDYDAGVTELPTIRHSHEIDLPRFFRRDVARSIAKGLLKESEIQADELAGLVEEDIELNEFRVTCTCSAEEDEIAEDGAPLVAVSSPLTVSRQLFTANILSGEEVAICRLSDFRRLLADSAALAELRQPRPVVRGDDHEAGRYCACAESVRRRGGKGALFGEEIPWCIACNREVRS